MLLIELKGYFIYRKHQSNYYCINRKEVYKKSAKALETCHRSSVTEYQNGGHSDYQSFSDQDDNALRHHLVIVTPPNERLNGVLRQAIG
jgi:hypothetical protein